MMLMSACPAWTPSMSHSITKIPNSSVLTSLHLVIWLFGSFFIVYCADTILLVRLLPSSSYNLPLKIIGLSSYWLVCGSNSPVYTISSSGASMNVVPIRLNPFSMLGMKTRNFSLFGINVHESQAPPRVLISKSAANG